MDRGTIPQQHPLQETLFSHPGAKPFDQLLTCALSAREAYTEAVGNLLVFWQILQNSFRGALHNELGMVVPVIVTTVEIVRFR